MNEPKPGNTKESSSDVLAVAAHASGRMRIAGRGGREYGVLRPGDAAWVSPEDIESQVWARWVAPTENKTKPTAKE